MSTNPIFYLGAARAGIRTAACYLIKENNPKMLIAGIITLAMAIGTTIAACYNKDILNFAKDHQVTCIAAASAGGAAFLSSATALGYFTYKRSSYMDQLRNPDKYIRKPYP